jgi:hypothetical protein
MCFSSGFRQAITSYITIRFSVSSLLGSYSCGCPWRVCAELSNSKPRSSELQRRSSRPDCLSLCLSISSPVAAYLNEFGCPNVMPHTGLDADIEISVLELSIYDFEYGWSYTTVSSIHYLSLTLIHRGSQSEQPNVRRPMKDRSTVDLDAIADRTRA